MSQRVGLLGGSFDPIHLGHLISARSIAEQLSLERVVLIPASTPPHKRDRPMSDARHRVAMARLAVEGDALFEVSEIELSRPGPSYTLHTVEAFRATADLGAGSLYWIIGSDSLPELVSWHRIERLVELVQIVTATRPGWIEPDLSALSKVISADATARLVQHCLCTPSIEISSTEIRDRIRSGRSIRYFTPEAVASYIQANRLYQP